MAKPRNEFTADVEAFISTGVDLRHLLVFVPWLHKLAEPTVKKSNEIMEKLGAPANSFGPATGSSVINIFHDGECITRAPAGKRITSGQDVRRMAAEVEGRVNASLLCALHEAWELYVKRVYGKMLFRLRGRVSVPNREGFHKNTPNWRSYRDTAEYFSEYAEFACRFNCSEVLKVLRNELDWQLVHVRRWHTTEGAWIEWMDVAKVLAFCRHCIVHSDGRVSQSRLKNLTKPLRNYVEAMMKETVLADEERVLPGKKTLDSLVEAMASLAYGLYVLVSMRCGLDVEYDLWDTLPKSPSRRS